MDVTGNANSDSELAIDVRGVGVLRGGRWILKDIKWQVPAGSCAAILGPNGSGKSTLARVIAAYLWPTSGDVTVLGERFGNCDMPVLRQQIKIVQPAGPYDVDPSLIALEVVLTGFFNFIARYTNSLRALQVDVTR